MSCLLRLLSRSKFPLSIFFLAFSIHLLHIGMADWGEALLPPYPRSDAYHYFYHAWFSAFIDPSGGYSSEFMPISIYVKVLTWVYSVFGNAAVVPFVFNALMMSLAAVFIALSSRQLFDAATGWLAGGMASLFGPFVFFAGITIKTNLVIFFLAMGCYFVVQYFHRGQARYSFAAVLAIGLAALERQNLLLLLLLFVFMVAGHVLREHSKLKRLSNGLGILSAIVVLLVVSEWNPFAGEPKVFSPVGMNFYVGNAPGSWGGYTPVEGISNDLMGHRTLAEDLAKKLDRPPLSRGEVSGYWFEQSWSYFKHNPFEYAELQLRKLGLLFAQGSQGLPETYPAWRWQRPALMLAVFDVGLVLVLAGFGLYTLRGRYNEAAIRFYLYATILYALSMWVFFIGERYRISMMVLLLPFAAFGLQQILFWRKGRKKLLLVVSCLVLFYLASIGLNRLIPAGPGWPSDFAQFRKNEVTRLEREQRHYRLMNAALQNPTAERWVSLSRIFNRKGFLLDAKLYAKRAIELAPERALGYEQLIHVSLPGCSERECRQLEALLVAAKDTKRSDRYIFRKMRERVALYLAENFSRESSY